MNNPMAFTDPTGMKPCNMKLIDGTEVDGECIDVEAPDPAVTPWELGWEWPTGTGPRDRTFTDGDDMTEMLKRHPHVQDVVQEVCGGSRDSAAKARYNLAGLV